MNIDDTATFVATGPLGQDVSIIEASDLIFLTEPGQRAHIHVVPFLGSHNALRSPLALYDTLEWIGLLTRGQVVDLCVLSTQHGTNALQEGLRILPGGGYSLQVSQETL